MEESHTIIDGKVHIYRRPNSRFWQCATYLGGYNHRATTKQASLTRAMDFAREWYFDRYAEDRVERRGLVAEPAPARAKPVRAERRPKLEKLGRTFREAAEAFEAEYPVLTRGERNQVYVDNKTRAIRKQLLPFFGDTPLTEVNAGMIKAYRMARLKGSVDEATGRTKRPAKSTLNQEFVTLRQILKAANTNGWISALPDMSAPYKGSGKVSHRAWFSNEEYIRLYKATAARAKNPLKERWRSESEQLHDYVLFMANTGLRPDEGAALEFRDVKIVKDGPTGQRILEIEVRGKRGVGYCKSMPGAVLPFTRLRDRASKDGKFDPMRLVFGAVQRELLNSILDEQGLKTDRNGKLRTAYSLRHTYICLRLLEGADIYQLAKNCRTSVEMIEKHYAIHLKNTLDAGAINVRRAKPG